MTSSRVNIAIIEQSEIIRIGIEHIVDSSPQLAIVQSSSGLAGSPNDSVDVVIINLLTLSALGRETLTELYPNAQIISLVYSYATPEQRSLCDGIIEIYDSPSEVLELLHRGVDSKDKSSAKAEAGELSEREMEIVAAVARGLINKEIADSLSISVHTVMAHRKNISRKTGIRSISGLVVYALLNGLIEQSEVLR